MSPGLISDELARIDALLAQGRFAAAITMLERIAFHNPEDSDVWGRLTDALIAAGEYERAAITSYAFEALAPSPQAYLMRSRALLQVDAQEALAPALSAQAAAPQEWAAHAQVARCYLMGHDSAGRGLAAAEQAVALAPQQAEAFAVLALAYRRHERFADAEQAAGKALSLDARNVEAQDVLQALTLLQPAGGTRTAAGTRNAAGAGQSRQGERGLLLLLALVCVLSVPVTIVATGVVHLWVVTALGVLAAAAVGVSRLRRRG